MIGGELQNNVLEVNVPVGVQVATYESYISHFIGVLILIFLGV